MKYIINKMYLLEEFQQNFELQQELKDLDKLNNKQLKILNDPKRLKKRLANLEKIKKEPSQSKIKEKLSKEINTNNFYGSNYWPNLIDKDTLLSKYNLKKLKKIGSGYTTYVFNNPIDKSLIIGFTVDDQKIKWLQANKKDFKFTLLEESPISKGNKLYVYSMIKAKSDFSKIPRKYQKILTNDVVSKFFDLRDKKNFGNVTIKDLDYIMYSIQDIDVLKILKKLKDTFPSDAALDLHDDQWGMVNNKLILFDPILSLKSLNQMENFNDLDLSTKFSLFVDKLFDNSDNDYIKKVLEKLRKN